MNTKLSANLASSLGDDTIGVMDGPLILSSFAWSVSRRAARCLPEMGGSSLSVDGAPDLNERAISLRLAVDRSRARGYAALDTLSSSSLMGKCCSHSPFVEDDEIERAWAN